MSTTTPRHRRPALGRLRHAGTWTAALGLGALSAACVTTVGTPAASSAVAVPVAPSPGTPVAVPVVLASGEPVLDPVRVSCEPDAAARFDDPNRPSRITNKACGYRGADGRSHSVDPWIEEQLAAVG